MTIDEIRTQFMIPETIIAEYEKLKQVSLIRKTSKAQYDSWDLERISLLMTLHEIGFTQEEIMSYMALVLSGQDPDCEKRKILNQKREHILEEIHSKEKTLDKLDFLRYGQID